MAVCGDLGVHGQSLEDGALPESRLLVVIWEMLSLEASLQKLL